MNIIEIEDCPDYLAPDNALAKEFLSPRNSTPERLNITKMTIPPLTSVKKHAKSGLAEWFPTLQAIGILSTTGVIKISL